MSSAKKSSCGRLFFWLAVAALAVIGLLAIVAWRIWRSFNLSELNQPPASLVSTSSASSSAGIGSDFWPRLLGFSRAQTYLILFQNNTELRPGGGFIGSYAVVRINRGRPEILKVEGTETLDRAARPDDLPAPPAQIQKYLGLRHWYVRDGNWSPDFAQSASQVLELYRAEGGVASSDITIVAGITPTVMERLLARIGDVEIDGVTFSPHNVTEKLEYEVEYGFAKRGVNFADRKNILDPFMRQIMARVAVDFFLHPQAYADLLAALADEAQIGLYAEDQAMEDFFISHKLDGRIQSTAGDSLLWVDANLGSLKTDHALARTLAYRITRAKDNYLGQASMEYAHRGAFDWRTTRYRSYARVYAPAGARLISAAFSGKKITNLPLSTVDQGQELGRVWFGAFISIEPGETKRLEFTYELPSKISDQIKRQLYTLFVHKQIGTIAHGLTLDLDFGKTIQAAMPAETRDKWGDERYELATDLKENREFTVSF